jgi:hypothetical protein
MVDCVNSSSLVLGVEGLFLRAVFLRLVIVSVTPLPLLSPPQYRREQRLQDGPVLPALYLTTGTRRSGVCNETSPLGPSNPEDPPPPPKVAASPRPVIPTVVPSIPPVSHLVALDTAGGSAGFNGGDSALEDMEGKGRINLARAQWHFDTKFRFAPPGAPCFPGLLEEFIDATKAAVHTAVHAHALADEELSAVFSRVLRFLWGTVAPASGGAIRLCRTWRGRVELTWRGRSRFDTKFRVTPRGAPRLDDVSVGCAAGSGAEFRFSPLALGHFSASCFGVHLRGLHVSEVS